MAESTTQQPTTEPVYEVPGHHWKEEDRVQEYVARTTAQADERRAFPNPPQHIRRPIPQPAVPAAADAWWIRKK